MQLAIGYATEDILDSAEYYASFLKTYISKKLNPPGMLENSYRVLGLIAKKKKHYEEALDYYRRDTALAVLDLRRFMRNLSKLIQQFITQKLD